MVWLHEARSKKYCKREQAVCTRRPSEAACCQKSGSTTRRPTLLHLASLACAACAASLAALGKKLVFNVRLSSLCGRCVCGRAIPRRGDLHLWAAHDTSVAVCNWHQQQATSYTQSWMSGKTRTRKRRRGVVAAQTLPGGNHGARERAACEAWLQHRQLERPEAVHSGPGRDRVRRAAASGRRWQHPGGDDPEGRGSGQGPRPFRRKCFPVRC